MNARAAKEAWVTQVLGCRFDHTNEAASRFESGRPKEAPKTATTGNLLAAMARAMPEAADGLPAVLSGMIPRFLLAIENEPRMDAQPLSEGSTVPAQDQLLGIADSLNAVLRSARRWEELLGQAEDADRIIDEIEAADRDEAQQETYENTVTSYNATRVAALREEERCMQLVNALAKEFQAVQGSASP
jgi:hypothetical protein